MKIWIDADACPNAVKQIIFRAAERRQLPVVMVANRPLALPPSPLFSMVCVAQGLDVADGYIVKMVEAGDLVITADLPLAAAVVERGSLALNPRGELYTAENVRHALSLRDFMQELRGAGMVQGGPAPLGKADSQRFAAALDRLLARTR
jgi:uncharacterized protein